MFETVEKLLALQDCDRRLHQLRTELSQIGPRRQLLLGKASASQSGLQAAKENALRIESERKRLELEVESKESQISKYLTQQTQTKKNDEYQALTHQIATTRSEIAAIEDQELELMEKGEAATKAVQAANALAKELKAMADGEVVKLDQMERDLKDQLADAESRRGQLAAAVEDSAALAKYERLVKTKGPSALVGIEHSVCGGCHMKLPAQIMLDCRAMDGMVACPNCARLLYYSEGVSLTAAS